MKSGNADGAKGGRKANASSDSRREERPASVPARPARQAGEDLWLRHGAERGVWSEKMLTALERGVEGGRWFSLVDKVYSDRTLSLAWEKVRSNAGACGVDGVTVARFGKDSQTRLLAVKERIKDGSYRPMSVKRVRIPKPGSKETRPLGIPTVLDRVVQQAARMVLEPIFESRFSESSYGFRPGRGCHDALRRVDGQLAEGFRHVVDIDIKGFFDAIDHGRLLGLVGEVVSDGRMLALVESFLRAGSLEGMEGWEPSETGTPQGGVISPLLANVYLDGLDHLMEDLGYAMTRYADDMVILCASRELAEAALEAVRTWTGQAGLELHPEKTRVVDMGEVGACFDFLGYRFKRVKDGRTLRLVRPKSERKLRDKARRLTRRCNGRSMEAIVSSLNPALKGWFAYFRLAHLSVHRGMDGWLRMRLRSVYRRRNRKRGRGRGIDHVLWPNRHFAELGLFSLEAAKVQAISLLRE